MSRCFPWFKLFVSLVLCFCLTLLVIRTWHWPVISDASVMHYVILLVHRGMAPYRDIMDINMPGTYLVEDAVIHIFGEGPLGWRLFDFVLLLFAGLAMVWIARPFGKFVGFFAGALFALIHWSDGVAQLGQRDLIISLFLALAYASLFCAVRRGSSFLMGLFGVCIGCATTIKPQALLLGVLLLGMASQALRKRSQPVARHLLGGFAGLIIPFAAVLIFLAKKQAFHSFFTTMQGLDIYHAGIARHSVGFLLTHAIPPLLLPLTLLASWIAIETNYWRTWEGAAILLGIGFGFGSFCLQGKAYPYHRYPLLVFLLLFIAIQFGIALRAGQPRHSLAYAGFIYGALLIAPIATAKGLRYNWRDESSLNQLQSELNQLGGKQLSGKIQCMDTISGCITVLDRMSLTQSTGFLYDCYFFAPNNSPIKQELREEFWKKIQESPPKVFVVSDSWCFNLPSGYQKLTQWHEFDNFLAESYIVSVQHDVEPGSYKHLATYPFGYRIYVRK